MKSGESDVNLVLIVVNQQDLRQSKNVFSRQ